MTLPVDILIPDFADFGAQRVAVNAANGLRERGTVVRFVVHNAIGPFRAELDERITVVELDPRFRAIPRLRVAQRIRAYATSIDPSASRVAVSFSPITNLAVLLAARRHPGLRTIVQEHALQSAALADHEAHPPAVRFIYRHGLVRLYRQADAVLAIARAVGDDLARHFRVPAHRIAVIPNPVDTARIRELAAAEPEPGLPVRRRYVLGLGRLASQKNFARLIRIFERLAPHRTDTDLVICGRGPRLAELRRRAAAAGLQGRVHFTGFAANPYSILARAGALCLSSDWEGLPQVVAEAMVCGTPVVAHRCPSGIAEMIEDGSTGRLVEFGDDDAFAAAILQTLADPEATRRRAAAARRFAVREYALKAYLDRLTDLIATIARAPRAAAA